MSFFISTPSKSLFQIFQKKQKKRNQILNIRYKKQKNDLGHDFEGDGIQDVFKMSTNPVVPAQPSGLVGWVSRVKHSAAHCLQPLCASLSFFFGFFFREEELCRKET